MTTRRPRVQAYPRQPKTIAAGEIFPINVGGNFINVLAADEDFLIRLDDQDEIIAKKSRKIRLEMGDSFQKVEVVNTSANALTFQLEIGEGDIRTDDLTISGNVSGIDDTVNVEMAAGSNLETAVNAINTGVGAVEAAVDDQTTALDAALADVETSVDEVAAILSDGLSGRAPLTDFSGVSVDGWNNSTSGTTKTLVTSGENINGIIIRHAAIMASVNGTWIGLKMDADYIMFVYANGNVIDTLDNILIPPGVELRLERSSAVAHINANIVFEVL